MPRIVFDKKEDFEIWVKENTSASRYIFYITDDNELVVYPSVSTRPLAIGYLSSFTEDLKKYGEEFAKNNGYRFFKIKRIEWDIEKAVGVKIGGD